MADQGARPPVVLRGGTVLAMDDAKTVLTDADVLTRTTGSPRSARRSTYPRAPSRSTRAGGIVMPGMIDTHRHMWQTAMRGYGADWTLTQYFVWYYLEHGKHLPPRGHPRRQPARGGRGDRRRRHHLRRLVARPPDRRPRRRRRRRAAGDPGPVRARLRQHPAAAVRSGRPTPEFRDFVEPPDHRRRHARLPDGLRRPRRPELPGAGRPSRWPASSAYRSPRTPASGARPTTTASG